MNSKKPFTGYLSFSRKDRIAAAGFVLLFGALYFLPRVFPAKSRISIVSDSLLHYTDSPKRTMAHRLPADEREYTDGPDASVPSVPSSLFPFDPNTLDAAGWERLGLPGRVARSLIRYREKGGRFRQPDDLRKIRALPPGFVDRVLPYIKIEDGVVADYTGNKPSFGSFPLRTHYEGKPTVVERTPRSVARVSINEADSATWVALPGIGATLAGRILRFRERLGGFVSIDQVGETWGLPDSSFQKIRPFLIFSSIDGFRKFNVNKATREELRAHPYLRWNLANAIVSYREKHGAFKVLEEIRNVLIMDDSAYKRIKPYLSISDD